MYNRPPPPPRPPYNFGPITDATKVFCANRIPDEMKLVDQWCYCQGTDPLNADYKRPRDPKSGHFASPKNPRSWGSFNQAMYYLKNVAGVHSIGFMFTKDDPYVGIDVDEKHADKITTAAMQAHDSLLGLCYEVDYDYPGTYVEMSHSGTGYHALFKGYQGGKEGVPGKYQSHCDQHMIEIFFHGCFMRMSGCKWQGTSDFVDLDKPFIDKLIERVQKATPVAAMEDVDINSQYSLQDYAYYSQAFQDDEVAQALCQLDESCADQSVVDLQMCLELCKLCPNDGLVLAYIRTTPRGLRIKNSAYRWTDGYAARTIGHARYKLAGRPPLLSKASMDSVIAHAVTAAAEHAASIKLPQDARARVVEENFVAPAPVEESKTGLTFADLPWPAPYPGVMAALHAAYMHNSAAYQPEMALAASLCAMATAVSPRVVTPTNCSTALYFLVFSPTGSGKNEMLRLLDGALAPAPAQVGHAGQQFPSAVVVHDVASREGLEQLWQSNRSILWRKDEIADYLNPKPTDMLKNNLKELLLSDFSHAPTTKRMPRARVARQGVRAPDPVESCPLNLMGTCVPTDIVDALSASNTAKGVANRMLFVPGRNCVVDMFAEAVALPPVGYGGLLMPVPGFGLIRMTYADGARELCGQFNAWWLSRFHEGDPELFARMGELLIRVATVVACQDPQNPLYTDQATGAPLWYVQQAHVQWAGAFCGCCFETVHRLATNGLGTQDAKDAHVVLQVFTDMVQGKTAGVRNKAHVAKYASRGMVPVSELAYTCTQRRLSNKAFEEAVKALIRSDTLQVVDVPVSTNGSGRRVKCFARVIQQ